MNDDLYFLPMIAQALQQPDPKAALRQALESIRTMGQDPRYRRGYQQFLRFMDTARRPGAGTDEELGAQLAETVRRALAMGILVERDEQLVGTCSFGLVPAVRTVDEIVPGRHRLKLETGRVLWEGRLTENDLLWANAFPGQPLRMAAHTGEPGRHPTREIVLLEGTVILRVFAGIEAGSLEIEAKPSEALK